MLGIDRFEGKLKFICEQCKHNNIALKNINLAGELKKDIFSINDFKFDWGAAGKINIKGSFGVSTEAPSMGVSLTISSLDLQDALTNSSSQIKGKLYGGGVIKTFGVSPYEWAKELKVTGKVALRDVIINNFDLNKIIDQSRKLYSVIDMNSIIKEATTSGSTYLSAIDGALEGDKSILQAKDFFIVTDRSRGIFAGNISTQNLKMKGTSKISYVPENGSKVVLSFALEGAVPNNITYTMDTTNLEQYITGKAGSVR